MKEYVVMSRTPCGTEKYTIGFFNDVKDIKVFHPYAVTAYSITDKITYNLEAKNA